MKVRFTRRALACALAHSLATSLGCLKFSHGPEVSTERELRVLAGAIAANSIDTGRVPRDYQEAMRGLMRDPLYSKVVSEYPDAVRGVDAWGRKLIYERVTDRQARLRSVGANGFDEQGGGDDIQKLVNIYTSSGPVSRQN
jgi:hypothetical protein